MGSSTSSFNCSRGHHFFEFVKWDLSSFNQLANRRSFQGLEFADHGTLDVENVVLATQCVKTKWVPCRLICTDNFLTDEVQLERISSSNGLHLDGDIFT